MSGVGKERSSAETGVELAFCVAPEREETYRRIETAGRKTEQRGLPFGRVASRIAAVRRWDNSLRYAQKPKASEQHRYQEHRRCLFKLNDWIHVVLPFFPRSVTFLDGGSGRGEEPSGVDWPPPDSDPFGDGSLKKIPLTCQIYSPQTRITDSSEKTRSAFSSERAMERRATQSTVRRYGGSRTREISIVVLTPRH